MPVGCNNHITEKINSIPNKLGMNYPTAEKQGIKSSFRKGEGLIRNLDSRFRGNDRHAASGGELNPRPPLAD